MRPPSGLSMAMKEEAKSISFVEDTAVAPERLRITSNAFWASSASMIQPPASMRTPLSDVCTSGRL